MAIVLDKFFIRSLIILFWASVFFLFLFSPRYTFWLRREKSLSIFTFPLLIDGQYIAEFERTTGIKLYIHYYESNDELLTKLRSTKYHGYDIVFPSDYVVKKMIKDGLLKKLDKSRLNFWHRLNPKLLGLYFDPQNDFSVPYLWELYGIGFNKEQFGPQGPPATWGVFFDKKIIVPNLGMLNNAREVIAIATLYLFGSVKRLNAKELKQVQHILKNQKKWVEVYTDLRADGLLLSKTCRAVAAASNNVWQIDDRRLGFLLPKEGGFVTADNICVTTSCQNCDLAYKFINYLFEHETVKHHIEEYAFYPTVTDVSFDRPRGRQLMIKALRNFDMLHFFKKVAPEKQLSELWISLKAE
jgi:spermidine/putrescine transport system substrate-binding protein